MAAADRDDKRKSFNYTNILAALSQLYGYSRGMDNSPLFQAEKAGSTDAMTGQPVNNRVRNALRSEQRLESAHEAIAEKAAVNVKLSNVKLTENKHHANEEINEHKHTPFPNPSGKH